LSRLDSSQRPAVAAFLEGMISGAGLLPAMKSGPGSKEEAGPEVVCDG
jgi:hypothetical protein